MNRGCEDTLEGLGFYRIWRDISYYTRYMIPRAVQPPVRIEKRCETFRLRVPGVQAFKVLGY